MGEGQTILSVEDDEDVREYTRVALTSLGYRVLEAGDGPFDSECAPSLDKAKILCFARRLENGEIPR
jgi:CheY-like chemotaxis protein